ncbi:hypothetical protein L218DRAFT_1006785 [Marasmius fiardii PR-910]|nr:hypothetical protein L218DRAFT_1006785 [Marasmius fiardii PR-910]
MLSHRLTNDSPSSFFFFKATTSESGPTWILWDWPQSLNEPSSTSIISSSTSSTSVSTHSTTIATSTQPNGETRLITVHKTQTLIISTTPSSTVPSSSSSTVASVTQSGLQSGSTGRTEFATGKDFKIAGAVLGGLLAFLVLITVVVVCYQRWNKNKIELELDRGFDSYKQLEETSSNPAPRAALASQPPSISRSHTPRPLSLNPNFRPLSAMPASPTEFDHTYANYHSPSSAYFYIPESLCSLPSSPTTSLMHLSPTPTTGRSPYPNEYHLHPLHAPSHPGSRPPSVLSMATSTHSPLPLSSRPSVHSFQ